MSIAQIYQACCPVCSILRTLLKRGLPVCLSSTPAQQRRTHGVAPHLKDVARDDGRTEAALQGCVPLGPGGLASKCGHSCAGTQAKGRQQRAPTLTCTEKAKLHQIMYPVSTNSWIRSPVQRMLESQACRTPCNQGLGHTMLSLHSTVLGFFLFCIICGSCLQHLNC